MSRRPRPFAWLYPGVLLLVAGSVWAQSRTPQIGYVFPAGGRQGTTMRVTIGGQSLRGCQAVSVSGRGVYATVGTYTRPIRRINRHERYLIVSALWDAQDRFLKRSHYHIADITAFQDELRKRHPWRLLNQTVDTDAYSIPKHPLLVDLEKADLRTIHHIQSYFFFPADKLQDNRQLAEHLVVELKIAPSAPRGTRELRLISDSGISNPIRFQIDDLPETREREPNDAPASTPRTFPPAIAKTFTQETHSLPLVMNGQVMPGDVDRLRFRASAGDQIRARIHARALIPFLADAVPGWFQCVLALLDADGNELAYADDNGIDPDPTLEIEIPADGTYVLVVRDAIYRGRQDFVYRLTLTDRKRKPLLRPDPPSDLMVPVAKSLRPPREQEPNDTPGAATLVRPPHTLSGAISQPGDVDTVWFSGRKGQSIVVETTARRLGSPLDSLLRLTDARGEVIAWNDDTFTKEKHLHVDHTGTTTHHADAYIRTTLPHTGKFFIQISDTQGNGSAAHTYSLRISEPQPSFALRVTPSGIAGGRRATLPLTVHALRRDGLDSAITLELVDPPKGVRLQNAVIPAGQTRVRTTLTLPNKVMKDPTPIRIRGGARHQKQYIHREALPADNVMQAFLWRHLVPAQELLLTTTKRWTPIPPLMRAQREPVRLASGKPATVTLRAEAPFKTRKGDVYTLKLDAPPGGVSLVPGSTRLSQREFRFDLLYTKATGTERPPPQNLILQALREYTPKPREGAPKPKRRQDPAGFLPAIPVTFP